MGHHVKITISFFFTAPIHTYRPAGNTAWPEIPSGWSLPGRTYSLTSPLFGRTPWSKTYPPVEHTALVGDTDTYLTVLFPCVKKSVVNKITYSPKINKDEERKDE